MASTRAVLRQRMSEFIGDYRSLTAAASQATTGAVIVSAGFPDYAENLDSYPYWYVLFTDSTATPNVGVSRAVLRTGGNTAPSVVTVTRVYPSQIATGDTFEFSKFDPVLKNNCLNRAAEELFKRGLYLPVRDETLVVDDILSNSDFESAVAAGAHPSWTNAGAGITVTGEATIVRHGTQSAKVVAGAGAAGQMYQAPTININQITGKTIVFKCWVYATVASIARVGLSFDGGTTITYNGEGYHTANDQWELLSVSTTVPTSATSVRAYLEAAAGGTAYFDACWLVIDPVRRYTVPTTFVSGKIYRIDQQENMLYPEGLYSEVTPDNPFVSGRRLRLIGKNYLARPSTESASMEVVGDQVGLVCYQALAFMYTALAMSPNGSERDGYLQNAAYWQAKTDDMLKAGGVLPPSIPSREHPDWKAERDGETVYLYRTDG